MNSRERVLAAIQHRPVDRMPVYAWTEANLKELISAAFGSVEAFEDHYEFDLVHLFAGPYPHPKHVTRPVEGAAASILPQAYLDVPLNDPNDPGTYHDLAAQIAHHQGERGRFVYVQTPGIFETLNDVFGLQNHLLYTALYPDALQQVYRRQAEWNRAFAMNCIDLGVDMIHVSDDWGGQAGLLFSPRTWWKLIYPNHEITCQAVLARGVPISMHSDGNINSVVDGVIKLGYQVVHPWQESAGMSLAHFKAHYREHFTVMGGLDVQTTIGFGKIDFLKSEIERVITLFEDGGLIFCTSHFIQDHCSLAELVTAFDLVHDLVHKPSRVAARV
ncbi:MAG: uroporphyrinogen decarboxylase family protein [Anaerolineales bacterium]